MDIFNLVGYDELYPLKMLRPDNKEETGVTLQIRCAGSTHVSDVIRKHVVEMKHFHMTSDNMNDQEKSDGIVALVERQQEEVHASYIADADWGKDATGDNPKEFTDKVAKRLMGVPWIFNDVREAALNLKLFMNA